MNNIAKTTDTINGKVLEVWDFDKIQVGDRIEATIKTHGRRQGTREQLLTGEVTWLGRGSTGRILSILINTSLTSANRGNRWINRLVSSTPAILVLS